MSHNLDIEKLDRVYQEDLDSFEKLINSYDMGIGVYNSNAVPLMCNPAAYRLLGLSKEQFMGNSAMDPYWKVTHEDGHKFETYDFPIIDVITNYKPKLGVIMVVSRPLLNDRVWLEVNTYPILDGGSIKHVICTYQDVSDKHDN